MYTYEELGIARRLGFSFSALYENVPLSTIIPRQAESGVFETPVCYCISIMSILFARECVSKKHRWPYARYQYQMLLVLWWLIASAPFASRSFMVSYRKKSIRIALILASGCSLRISRLMSSTHQMLHAAAC